MTAKITLIREQFSRQEQEIYSSSDFTVISFKYASGIEALKIVNSRGYVTVLPYYGQMIWDAEFDGHNLKMENMKWKSTPCLAIVRSSVANAASP